MTPQSTLYLSLAVALSACDGGAGTPAAAPATYFVAHGTWVLDDSEQSFTDGRNPRRLVLETTEVANSRSVFSFYADVAGKEPLATGCSYQYNRSQPDSHRFPADKEAIWVMFELAPGSTPACAAFKRVAFAPTLDGDAAAPRVHLRYGPEDYAELVGPTFSDPASERLWWSIYKGVSGQREAPTFPYDAANGERVIDPSDSAALADTRNPSRVEMTTSDAPESESRFVFYANGAPDVVWADCNFQVRYTMPDPRMFPGDKAALWDAFELTKTNSGACEQFAQVVLFWPEGRDAMFLRYGVDGFEPLLSESLADAPRAAWWAAYCTPGDNGCGAP